MSALTRRNFSQALSSSKLEDGVADAHRQLTEMYDIHAPRIFRYIYHRLGDQALAEDLTSEVFVRFLCARVAPDNLAAFLFRVAHNLIVDYLRRHRSAPLLDENLVSDQFDPRSEEHTSELQSR